MRAARGRRELLRELKRRGLTVVLASSSSEDDLEFFVGKLAAADCIDGWTSKDDVERTKPHPDPIEAALEKAGTDTRVMLGDSRWDIEAAAKAGLQTICVLTGGWSSRSCAIMAPPRCSSRCRTSSSISTRRRSADARVPCRRHGGGSSVGRAPGCGPGGRGFKSRPPPSFAVVRPARDNTAMAEDAGERSWWQTLPGMLTAAATLIAAVTGRVVALHQIFPGGHSGSQTSAVTTAPEVAATGSRRPPATRSRPVQVPPTCG